MNNRVRSFESSIKTVRKKNKLSGVKEKMNSHDVENNVKGKSGLRTLLSSQRELKFW